MLVSINCITYNHEDYIEDALKGFLSQKTNFDYEILVHDDASTDSTANIIRKYQRLYPDKIKTVLQTENQSYRGLNRVSYEYNHKCASGKYIAMCEGDDYWTDPYKLQKQVDYMEQNPECSICFHAVNLVNSKKVTRKIYRPFNENRKCNIDDAIIGGGGFMPTQSILYRKSSFDNPPELYFNAPIGDYPMQMIIIEKGYGYYMNEVMASYRRVLKKGSSWSSSNNSQCSLIKLSYDIKRIITEFNEYTEGKYINSINQVLDKCNFEIAVMTRNWEYLMSDSGKRYFSLSAFSKKRRYVLLLLVPKIYLRMLEIRYN